MLQSIFEQIRKRYDDQFKVLDYTPLTGGDINSTYKLETKNGYYCLKFNNSGIYPEMFSSESKGLGLLRQSNFVIPEVIDFNSSKACNYLLLEYIDPGVETEDFWMQFGRLLNQMHCISNTTFGLDHDNYIGTIAQSNLQKNSWAEFYVENRILPLLEKAIKKEVIAPYFLRKIDSLYQQIERLYPNEAPALLHGDLWSGNYLIANDGTPCLIDPSVYFGHREMDIGMMLLFGGFSEELFESYNAQNALGDGWEERIPLSQLYPLLVHLNLFGKSYLSDVDRIFKYFT